MANWFGEKKSGGVDWPLDARNKEVATMRDPITGIEMCKDCWNGSHARKGSDCRIPGCMCGCYHGSSKGLNGLRRPAKGVDSFLPDVGGFAL